ncbi:hypothetical protein ACS0TY_022960 [Phlomoides rotata]
MGTSVATPIVLDSSSLNTSLNPFSLLALQHNDNPAVSIVFNPFNGVNFILWSHIVKRTLSVKNKLPLIDGPLLTPSEAEDKPLYLVWVRANDLVLLWILNSINQDIK